MKLTGAEVVLAIFVTILLLLILSAYNPAIIKFALHRDMLVYQGPRYYYGLGVLLAAQPIFVIYLLAISHRIGSSKPTCIRRNIFIFMVVNIAICFGVVYYSVVLPWGPSNDLN